MLLYVVRRPVQRIPANRIISVHCAATQIQKLVGVRPIFGVRIAYLSLGPWQVQRQHCVVRAALTTCFSAYPPSLQPNKFGPIYFFSPMAAFTAERKPPGFSVPVDLKTIRP
jgi:hypothetical protein